MKPLTIITICLATLAIILTACNPGDILGRLGRGGGDRQWDCPDLQANFGDRCITNDGKPGFINKDCNCEPVVNSEWDCPDIQKNFGDRCITEDGQPGIINKDCNCQPFDSHQWDCPEIKKNFGDPCVRDDGSIGFVNKDCECQGREDNKWDCPEIQANFGDPCYIIDPNSNIRIKGIIDEDCDCVPVDQR